MLSPSVLSEHARLLECTCVCVYALARLCRELYRTSVATGAQDESVLA